jgi:hypothetical protein
MSIVNSVSRITPSTSILAPIESFTNAALNRILGYDSKSSSLSAIKSSASQDIPKPSVPSSFSTILGNLLPSNQKEKINEEQLFAALIEERLTTLKGAENAKAYHQLFTSYQESMVYAKGSPKTEEAARAALSDLVTKGTLTTEEAEKIHAQAFRAAQIDGNSKSLYDSFGDTMAVTMVNLALASSKKMMAQFDSGEVQAGRLSLNYQQEKGPAEIISGEPLTTPPATTPTAFVGGDGFLFKPISESNGNLVILLPAAMKQKIASVTLTDSTGQLLETGDLFGTFNDGRPIFHFNKPGSNYPTNITVTVTMLDGTKREYHIPEPSQRYE